MYEFKILSVLYKPKGQNLICMTKNIDLLFYNIINLFILSVQNLDNFLLAYFLHLIQLI